MHSRSMGVRRRQQVPWERKHELLEHIVAPEIAYPTSLDELIELCRDQPPGQAMHAAGSHWALSTAAESDHTFIETRDPTNQFPAMARTLTEVIPGCMTDGKLQLMARGHPVSFESNLLNGAAADDTPYYVHVEAGKRVYELYAELDQDAMEVAGGLAAELAATYDNHDYAGPWAFRTLGAAGGQTVFGALTTGTHGGDVASPPIADDVVAIHLVTDGGRHYWIEPPLDREHATLTDEVKLRALYGQRPRTGPATEFDVIRDATLFRAVLVGAHRFGVVYSFVLRARRQYMMRETRVLGTWQNIRTHLDDDLETSWLYAASWPATPGAPAPLRNKFLQIVVCLTPFNGFEKNLVGITKRSDVPWTPPSVPRGRPERVGERQPDADVLTGNPVFANAGTNFPLDPTNSTPGSSAAGGFLNLACAQADFMPGLIREVIDEIKQFIDSPAVIPASIAAMSAVTALGGLSALFGPLGILLVALAALVDRLSDDDRLGQTLDRTRKLLLDDSSGPAQHAGLFIWHLIAFKVFVSPSNQGPIDHTGISYAILDNHNYKDRSCQVNVDSIEVFFDVRNPMLPIFIDGLIAFEKSQEASGRAIVGYASLRFIGKSDALLHPARWERTCVVEVAGLRDTVGSTDLIDYAIRLALDPQYGGVLHWGQRNPSSAADIDRLFGPATDPESALGAWKRVLRTLIGGSPAFSSKFTIQTGAGAMMPQRASPAFEVRGQFRLEVTYLRGGAWPQRITISGSDGSDGAHDAVVGLKLDISGSRWRCQSEWLVNASWNVMYEIRATYGVRIPARLVIEIGGWNWFTIRPNPSLDIVWTLTSTNPATALPPSVGGGPDFSIGEQARVAVGVAAVEAAGINLLALP